MVRNIKHILKISFIILFIFFLILANIISDDAHDLDHCENEHCIICAIIQIARIIVNNILAFIVLVDSGFLIYLFLSRINKEKLCFTHTTMINQKVQLNE